MLWKIKLDRTGPELNCSHRTRSIRSILVSVWQKKPSLDSKRVITRFRSKSNQPNSPFTSGAERSENLSDTNMSLLESQKKPMTFVCMVCVMAPDFLSRDAKLFPENSGKIKYYNLCNAPCLLARPSVIFSTYFLTPWKAWQLFAIIVNVILKIDEST